MGTPYLRNQKASRATNAVADFSRHVVVMGHEGCGAVQAAMLDEAERRFESQYIQFLLDRIVPSVSKLPRIRDSKARMREAVIANVRTQVHQLKQNPVVLEAMQKKEIAVIGAYYEISSGAVDFLETEEDLRLYEEEFSG
jgi:carbonic anhydrase